MPIHRNLNRDFFKKWSPGMAYVLGYFAADGSMIQTKRGGHYIEFTSTDKILLQRVRALCGARQSIGVKKKHINQKQGYRLQIGSKEWFADLTRLRFVQNKSLILELPSMPRGYQGDFVRGYFDGDGCIYVRKLKFADRVRKRWVVLSIFTSGSKKFLIQLHDLLKKHGIVGGSLVKKTRGYELKLSHRDSVALYHFMYHTSPVLAQLPRKRVKFDRAVRILGYRVRS